jgi:hypothetical protein
VHVAFLEKYQVTLKNELEKTILKLEKVQESLSFERKEFENVKVALKNEELRYINWNQPLQIGNMDIEVDIRRLGGRDWN